MEVYIYLSSMLLGMILFAPAFIQVIRESKSRRSQK